MQFLIAGKQITYDSPLQKDMFNKPSTRAIGCLRHPIVKIIHIAEWEFYNLAKEQQSWNRQPAAPFL